MSITNYSELKLAVADWLNRDDIDDARLSDFVRMAENRIFHELRIPEMEATSTATTDSEGRVLLPADYLEAKDVLFNDEPLSRISATEFYARLPVQGKPESFARDTIYLRLWPLPETTTDFRMVYYARPVDLSTAAPTNVVFAVAPELYLYGALIAGGVYLGTPIDRIGTWSESFNDVMRRLTTSARQADVSGATTTVANGY